MVQVKYRGHRTALAPSFAYSSHPCYPCNGQAVAPSWMFVTGSCGRLCNKSSNHHNLFMNTTVQPYHLYRFDQIGHPVD